MRVDVFFDLVCQLNEAAIAGLVPADQALAPLVYQSAPTGPLRHVRVLHQQFVQASQVLDGESTSLLLHLDPAEQVQVFLEGIGEDAEVSLQVLLGAASKIFNLGLPRLLRSLRCLVLGLSGGGARGARG